MRHRKKVKKLGRDASHRNAMLRNLATDLLRHERVTTTLTKAKAVRPFAERLVTLGKRDTLHARRHAARLIRDKVFNELAPRYAERPGGYTRIMRLDTRPGDRADMAVIEMVDARVKG